MNCWYYQCEACYHFQNMLKVPLRVVKVPEAEVLKSDGYYGDERVL